MKSPSRREAEYRRLWDAVSWRRERAVWCVRPGPGGSEDSGSWLGAEGADGRMASGEVLGFA